MASRRRKFRRGSSSGRLSQTQHGRIERRSLSRWSDSPPPHLRLPYPSTLAATQNVIEEIEREAEATKTIVAALAVSRGRLSARMEREFGVQVEKLTGLEREKEMFERAVRLRFAGKRGRRGEKVESDGEEDVEEGHEIFRDTESGRWSTALQCLESRFDAGSSWNGTEADLGSEGLAGEGGRNEEGQERGVGVGTHAPKLSPVTAERMDSWVVDVFSGITTWKPAAGGAAVTLPLSPRLQPQPEPRREPRPELQRRPRGRPRRVARESKRDSASRSISPVLVPSAPPTGEGRRGVVRKGDREVLAQAHTEPEVGTEESTTPVIYLTPPVTQWQSGQPQGEVQPMQKVNIKETKKRKRNPPPSDSPQDEISFSYEPTEKSQAAPSMPLAVQDARESFPSHISYPRGPPTPSGSTLSFAKPGISRRPSTPAGNNTEPEEERRQQNEEKVVGSTLGQKREHSVDSVVPPPVVLPTLGSIEPVSDPEKARALRVTPARKALQDMQMKLEVWEREKEQEKQQQQKHGEEESEKKQTRKRKKRDWNAHIPGPVRRSPRTMERLEREYVAEKMMEVETAGGGRSKKMRNNDGGDGDGDGEVVTKLLSVNTNVPAVEIGGMTYTASISASDKFNHSATAGSPARLAWRRNLSAGKVEDWEEHPLHPPIPTMTRARARRERARVEEGRRRNEMWKGIGELVKMHLQTGRMLGMLGKGKGKGKRGGGS